MNRTAAEALEEFRNRYRRMTQQTCRHCRVKPVRRPRGLCWQCYYTPGVCDLYPSTSKFARRGYRDHDDKRPMPTPTRALPGTPEKIAVLEFRASQSQELFHPDDHVVTCRFTEELP